MSNFFDDLERQLRKALTGTTRELASTPWWRRPRTALLAAIATAAFVTPALAAVTGVWSPGNGPAPPMATETAQAPSSCAGKAPAPHTTFTQQPPSAALRRVLGVLRRPRARADRFDALDRLPLADVNRAAIRHVGTTPSGERYFVVPNKGSRIEQPLPERCLQALAPAQRNEARRRNRRLTHPRAHPQICLLSSNGGGTCGDTATTLSARGSWGASGTPDGRTEVVGLVPDGVVKVTITYRDGSTRTFPVRDNFYSYQVSLPPERADPQTITWKDKHSRNRRTVSGSPSSKP